MAELMDDLTFQKKLVPAQIEFAYALHGLLEAHQNEAAMRALRALAVTGNFEVAIAAICEWELEYL